LRVFNFRSQRADTFAVSSPIEERAGSLPSPPDIGSIVTSQPIWGAMTTDVAPESFSGDFEPRDTESVGSDGGGLDERSEDR